MGFVAAVTSFARIVIGGAQAPECTLDRDGDETVTAHHFGSPGDDAPPLPGDLAFLADDTGAGEASIVGYQDPSTAGVAAPGERRIYARASAGVVSAAVWLKADGSITLESPLSGASIALAADGSITLSTPLGSLAIDASGNVTATTPLGSFGSGTHTHTTPFGPSGPPIPGT